MKTIEELQRDWKTILDNAPAEFKRTNALSLLRCGTRPDSITNKTIFIKCRFNIHADNLNLERNKVIVRKILSLYMGEEVSYNALIGEVPLTPEEQKEFDEKQAREKEEKKKQAESTRRQLIQILRKESNIPIEYLNNLRFENYEVKTDIQKRAIEAAKAFCHYEYTDEQYANCEWWWSILFHGSCGTGKTHLAIAIGNYFLDLGYDVKFWTTPGLLLKLREGFVDNSYFEILRKAKDVEILILDDWGMHKQTDWADEQLDELINYRYSHKKDTIITTNLSYKELQRRVGSRLGEGLTVCMTGEDYRLLKGLGKVKKNKPEVQQ